MFLKIPKGLQLYLKKAPTQMFYCEVYKIFNNTYFEEHLRTAVSTECVRSSSLLFKHLGVEIFTGVLGATFYYLHLDADTEDCNYIVCFQVNPSKSRDYYQVQLENSKIHKQSSGGVL